MNLTIYVDILFLLNMILDYIILSSTAFISGAKIVNKRLLPASCIGALYSVIVFFPTLAVFNIIIFKLAISALIVFVAFKYHGIISYAKRLFTYYLTNIIYGGGVYAFYNFTVLGSKMNYSNGIYYIDLPLWSIIAISFIFYFAIKLLSKISDAKSVQKSVQKVDIYFMTHKISANALFDTGNTLYDPITLLPVMLVESRLFEGSISKSVLDEIRNGQTSSLSLIYGLYPKMKFRVIPFQDITGRKKNIFAFKPEKVIKTENNLQIENVLVGIIDTKLSDDNTYNALLHSKT